MVVLYSGHYRSFNDIQGRMDYFGPFVNRSARLAAVAEGGQVVASRSAYEEVEEKLTNTSVLALGAFKLKGLSAREIIYQV
jgi:class 3 adenylate cyclase